MKRSLLFLTIILFGTSAAGQTLTEQLRACAAIESSGERLGCYDAINESLDQRVEQSFGQESELAAQIAEEAPESILVAIVEMQEVGLDGQLVITLDNGQIWRQIDVNRVDWLPGEEVEITRGLFRSFFMRSAEGGARIRVSRAN
jgi:hypothetical protein